MFAVTSSRRMALQNNIKVPYQDTIGIMVMYIKPRIRDEATPSQRKRRGACTSSCYPLVATSVEPGYARALALAYFCVVGS